MGKKLTYEYIKSYIEGKEGNGCKLLMSEEEFELAKIEQGKSASRILLNILCGQCKKENFNASFNSFENNNKKQCNDCGKDNVSSKQSKSHEEFIEDVRIKKKDKFIILGKYKNNKTKVLIKCKECGHEWKVRPDNFLNSDTDCPECFEKTRGENLKMSVEEFEKRFEPLKDKYKILSKFDGCKNKIKVQHLECGYIWSPDVYRLINQRVLCPKCSKNMKKDTKYFKQEVYDLVGDEYTVLGEYINNQTKIKIKHNICNSIYKVRPNDFLFDRRCPICAESKGEQKIRHWLEDSNKYFSPQYVFEDCKDKKELPFDFAIFEDKEKTRLKCLIEYDGEGHYDEKVFGKKSFEITVKHDKMKNKYCEINNVELIRIPYWDFDNVEKILKNLW